MKQSSEKTKYVYVQCTMVCMNYVKDVHVQWCVLHRSLLHSIPVVLQLTFEGHNVMQSKHHNYPLPPPPTLNYRQTC